MEVDVRLQNKHNRDAFDTQFRNLFYSSDSGANVLAYIRWMLLQFQLDRAYEVHDILTEVYTRGRRLIDRGGNIHLLPAWTRRTALNVIRGLRRERDKVSDYLDLDDLPSSEPNYLSELMMADQAMAMKSAFEQLDDDSRTILWLQVVEKMSWQDVRKKLATLKGSEAPSESALRQKGFRALRRLRAIYEEIQEQTSFDSAPNETGLGE